MWICEKKKILCINRLEIGNSSDLYAKCDFIILKFIFVSRKIWKWGKNVIRFICVSNYTKIFDYQTIYQTLFLRIVLFYCEKKNGRKRWKLENIENNQIYACIWYMKKKQNSPK